MTSGILQFPSVPRASVQTEQDANCRDWLLQGLVFVSRSGLEILELHRHAAKRAGVHEVWLFSPALVGICLCHGLLSGSGKLIRHVRLRSTRDTERPELRALVEEAAAHALGRLGSRAPTKGKAVFKSKRGG